MVRRLPCSLGPNCSGFLPRTPRPPGRHRFSKTRPGSLCAQHHGQRPALGARPGQAAPRTAARVGGGLWQTQSLASPAQQGGAPEAVRMEGRGKKPPARLRSGGGGGGGARGEIIQELCRFRLKTLPAAGVHVECRDGGCTWMPWAPAVLLPIAHQNSHLHEPTFPFLPFF